MSRARQSPPPDPESFARVGRTAEHEVVLELPPPAPHETGYRPCLHFSIEEAEDFAEAILTTCARARAARDLEKERHRATFH